MNCEGYPSETYGLYVLGLLEEAEAAEVRSHVESSCPACCRELRAAAVLWFLVGVSQADEASARPSGDLRRRILQGASGLEVTAGRRGSPVMKRLGAIAAGLFICTAVWFASKSYNSRRPVGEAGESAALAQYQTQVREWRRRAETAEKRVESLQTAPAPAAASAKETVTATVTDPNVSAQLGQALTANRNLEDSLARERSRASALEAELASQRLVLAAAQQQKSEADKRAEAATEDRARLAAREERLAALAGQVQDLERQNATYRETVTRLQREFDRNVRLVAFLSAPSLRMVKLDATEAAHQAEGHAFILDNQKVLFYATNLPPLPPGRTYQLWIVSGKGQGIISGGVSRPDNSHRVSLEFENAALLRDVRGLAVTEEPAGGSPGPTGHKILVGTARS